MLLALNLIVNINLCLHSTKYYNVPCPARITINLELYESYRCQITFLLHFLIGKFTLHKSLFKTLNCFFTNKQNKKIEPIFNLHSCIYYIFIEKSNLMVLVTIYQFSKITNERIYNK